VVAKRATHVTRKSTTWNPRTGSAGPSPASPAPSSERGEFAAPADKTLAAGLREHLPDRSWQQVRELCGSGKVVVDGTVELDPARRLSGGERVAWNMAKPDPRRRAATPGFRVVFEDGHLIVIEKPEGVSTVPYERKETGTALDLIREAWRRNGKRATTTPLYVVHRIDKDTSGLVCFAKTKLAERGLHHIFKQHLAEREYLAVAQGHVHAGRIESRLIENRGDGLRGSSRRSARPEPPDRQGPPHRHGRAAMPSRPSRPGWHEEGQHAITHVEVVERFPAATLCRVRLETGRTHQIRIHLSEQGNPLVGETVYIRDLLRRGGKPIASKRLLLHAATLGFDHPVTGEKLSFQAELPAEFQTEIEKLRR
jgi:23S rRNA pseudouridine1911/1915/1917 synthase